MGVFAQPDPIDYQGRLTDPQQLNPYAYARGNPLRYVDPDGRQTAETGLVVRGGATPALRQLATWASRAGPLGPAILAGSALGFGAAMLERAVSGPPRLRLDPGAGFQAKGNIRIPDGAPQLGRTDIALGMKVEGNLYEFADSMGAAPDEMWGSLGLQDADVGSFGEAFMQATTRAIESGGRIKFQLQGLDPTKAMTEPNLDLYGEGVGYTEWELQQVVTNEALWENTDFYLGEEELTREQLKEMGINPIPQ